MVSIQTSFRNVNGQQRDSNRVEDFKQANLEGNVELNRWLSWLIQILAEDHDSELKPEVYRGNDDRDEDGNPNIRSVVCDLI